MSPTYQNPLWNNEPESRRGRGSVRQFRVVPKTDPLRFSSLEFADSRKNAVVVSVISHCVILGVLLAMPLFIHEQLNVSRYYSVTLVPPVPRKEVVEVTHWKPVALPPPKLQPTPAPVKVEAPRVELQRPNPPKPAPEEFKPPEVKLPWKPALLTEAKREELKTPEAPKEVKTNVFGSAGSSATSDVKLPAKEIQTGGFGDPNGMKAEGKPGKEVNIGALGAFDLPVGPGAGNGTGGGKGVKGVVASAGFGNGVATDTPGAGRAGVGVAAKTVRQGGFQDMDALASAAASTTTAKKRDAEVAATPVEITFKPRPDYTGEARKLKIEGEVLVRVVFTASGQIKVLGVTRGLGYGLDENAVKAAEEIKFKPAAREGTPIDSTATVRIVFQLAY